MEKAQWLKDLAEAAELARKLHEKLVVVGAAVAASVPSASSSPPPPPAAPPGEKPSEAWPDDINSIRV